MRIAIEAIGPILLVFMVFGLTTVARRLSYGHAAWQPADGEKIRDLLTYAAPFMLLCIVYRVVERARLDLWVEVLVMAGVMVAFASVTFRLLRQVADEA